MYGANGAIANCGSKGGRVCLREDMLALCGVVNLNPFDGEKPHPPTTPDPTRPRNQK